MMEQILNTYVDQFTTQDIMTEIWLRNLKKKIDKINQEFLDALERDSIKIKMIKPLYLINQYKIYVNHGYQLTPSLIKNMKRQHRGFKKCYMRFLNNHINFNYLLYLEEDGFTV